MEKSLNSKTTGIEKPEKSLNKGITMKHHNRIQNQISAYLDDELSPEQRTIVETHLSECHECAEILADFQQNRQWMGALTHEAPPIADLVLPQLADRGAARRKLFPSFGELWDWVCRPAISGVGALVTVGLVLTLVYFNLMMPGSKDTYSSDSLDFYLTVHTEDTAYNPLYSYAVTDSFGVDTNIPETTIEDNTDLLLEVHLGD